MERSKTKTGCRCTECKLWNVKYINTATDTAYGQCFNSSYNGGKSDKAAFNSEETYGCYLGVPKA